MSHCVLQPVISDLFKGTRRDSKVHGATLVELPGLNSSLQGGSGVAWRNLGAFVLHPFHEFGIRKVAVFVEEGSQRFRNVLIAFQLDVQLSCKTDQ